MHIVHLCLSNFYIDGFSYQENELVAQNVQDGHDVTVIASVETFDSNMRLTYVKPSEYMGKDGARVIRIPYRRWIPHMIARKLRSYVGLYDLLRSLSPDVIFFHGMSAWELTTVRRFKRDNPSITLFLDNHADFNNSARGFFSKWILHYAFYRAILRLALPYVDKVFCVSLDSMGFAERFYGVDRRKLEYFPLGGKVLDDCEYTLARETLRKRLGIAPDALVFIQSGKIDRKKRILDSLEAFCGIKSNGLDVFFLIVGHVYDEVSGSVDRFMESDPRIYHLGWLKPEELRAVLCASDVYVQPGSQSATMQMSLCCRNVVVLDAVSSHRPFVNENGWLVRDKGELRGVFLQIIEEFKNGTLQERSNKSLQLAREMLDYRRLACRVYKLSGAREKLKACQ